MNARAEAAGDIRPPASISVGSRGSGNRAARGVFAEIRTEIDPGEDRNAEAEIEVTPKVAAIARAPRDRWHHHVTQRLVELRHGEQALASQTEAAVLARDFLSRPVEEPAGAQRRREIPGLVVGHHGIGEDHLLPRALGLRRRDVKRRLACAQAGEHEHAGGKVVGPAFGQQALRTRSDREMTAGREQPRVLVVADLIRKQQHGSVLYPGIPRQDDHPRIDVVRRFVRMHNRG